MLKITIINHRLWVTLRDAVPRREDTPRYSSNIIESSILAMYTGGGGDVRTGGLGDGSGYGGGAYCGHSE